MRLWGRGNARLLGALAPIAVLTMGTTALHGDARAAIVRDIPLAELGRDAGLTVAAVGSETLHYPVGDAGAIRSMILSVPFTAPDDLPEGTRLRLFAGAEFTVSRAVHAGESGIWRIAVPRSAAAGGYVPVRLALADASGDAACPAMLGSARVTLTSQMAMRVAYADSVGQSVGAMLAHAPRRLSIAMPARPDEAQVAAALRLAALRQVRFGETAPMGTWTQTRLRFDDAPGPLRIDGAAQPALIVGREHTAALPALLATPAATGAPLPLAALAAGADGGSGIALSALGQKVEPRTISDRGGWTFYLPANRIPADRGLSSLRVHVAMDEDGGGGGDGGGGPAVATLALNGQVLTTRAIEPGAKAWLNADIPAGLTATTNRIDIGVLRQPRADDCLRPQMGQVARLLPDSRALFGKASKLGDFADLPAAFAGGVTLVIPGGIAGERIGALARMMSGMIGAATPLTVSFGAMPDAGAVIWFSPDAPPGQDMPLPMTRDDARIRDADGNTIVSAGELARLTSAQFLSGGDRPILWIRPGNGFADLSALPAGAELSYGDLALFDAGSRVFAMHTGRERLVRIDHAGDFHLGEWFDANRIWLVLAAWAAITALFAWLWKQTTRARSARLEGDGDA